ncbi:MAG: hypothetical protein ABIV26_06790, partial [Candidatus Limnocylindrales bacterium]
WFPLEPRDTRLVGTWVREPSAVDFDRGEPADPERVNIARLPLEAGEQRWIDTTVQLPEQPGTWHLVVDVVDDAIGSLASAGSIPGDVMFEVVAPPPAR